MTEISNRRTAGQPDGREQPVPRPSGLRAACGDDLKDEIPATIQSLLGQKPFLLLFTIPRSSRGLYLAEAAESVDQSVGVGMQMRSRRGATKTLVRDWSDWCERPNACRGYS